MPTMMCRMYMWDWRANFPPIKEATVHPRISVLFLLALATPLSRADDLQPGLWEISMESRVAATPDFTPPANTMNQCLTAQDAKDPSRVLGGVANPGATDCKYTESSFVGSIFRFKMSCADTLGLQSRGELTYTATSMKGSITSTTNMMGQVIELQSKITARRLGDCQK